MVPVRGGGPCDPVRKAFRPSCGQENHDLDFAVHVASWEHYECLKSSLLADERFKEDVSQEQRLIYGNFLVIDLIPYGPLSSEEMEIVWPGSGNAMEVVGFEEIYESSLRVNVNDSLELRVLTPPSLLALKLLAWKDRRMSKPRSDAKDIATIVNAGKEWYRSELFEEYLDVMEESEYDPDLASAIVLGIQIGETLHRPMGSILCGILGREIEDAASPLVFDLEYAFGSSRNTDFVLNILKNILDGIKRCLADC